MLLPATVEVLGTLLRICIQYNVIKNDAHLNFFLIYRKKCANNNRQMGNICKVFSVNSNILNDILEL